MAVYDVNRIANNVGNLNSSPSKVTRNIFSIKLNKGTTGGAPAANDWLDLLNIPPNYQITDVSVMKPTTASAGAYKLIIADGPALSDKAADGTARVADKTLVTFAAAALKKDTWQHYSYNGAYGTAAATNAWAGHADWWVEHDDYRALSLQVTTWAAADLNDTVKFVIGWSDMSTNYRG